jgi:hypothetical protein
MDSNPWTSGNWKLENGMDDHDSRKRLLLWHQDKKWHILQEEAIAIGVMAKNHL